MTIITRFPPSPTGYLHLGGARTALFNWLYARKHNGKMILRIEDTDRERSTDEAVQAIFDGLKWLGLDWDQGPFYQSQRFARYDEAIQQLLQQGKAYYCHCSRDRLDQIRVAQMKQGLKPRYDKHCRDLDLNPSQLESAVIRFCNPVDGVVSFNDMVRGRVTVDNQQLDDLIIARSDGTPTYNFTVVVDDIDMRISHVIRGDDHTSNTPRQINLFHALKSPIPVFAHVPMILGEDGQKLSKRHGAISIKQYDHKGVVAEAMLNYLVRLGWSHGDQEIFSIKEMIELFAISNINKSAASFDENKLFWLNQHYIKHSDCSYLSAQLQQRLASRNIETQHGVAVSEVVEALRERVQTLEEMADKATYFYQDFNQYDPKAVKKYLRPVAGPLLVAVRQSLAELNDWNAEAINDTIKQVAQDQKVNLAKIAQPLRVALAGVAATPSIDITVKLVGRVKTLARIDKAIEMISKRSNNA